jgi:hypothetical protein
MYGYVVRTTITRSLRRLLAVTGLAGAFALVLASCSSSNRAFDAQGAPPGEDGGTNNGGSAGKNGAHSGAGHTDADNAGQSGSDTGGEGGGGGESGGAIGASGAGSSTPDCGSADDCEGKDSDCAQRTCSDGKCGVEYAKNGVAIGDQIAGDCNRTVCDGKGGTLVVADDGDLPVDGNVCTKDVCKNGVHSNPNEPTTVSCGATSQFKCDGTGKCGNCAVDADCGQNNICATFSCNAGNCKTTFLNVDPGQSAGDCKKAICSNGSITATIDNTDLPVDGKVCTKDLCTNGAPSNPALPATTSCGANSTCDANGNCVCADPNACAGKCGNFNDACGHAVSCGGCTAPQTCSGGATPNVCGCTPHPVCHDQCGGQVGNGCGALFTCPATNECTCNQGCTPVCGGDICQCAGFCG